jgi:hypothetical protein
VDLLVDLPPEMGLLGLAAAISADGSPVACRGLRDNPAQMVLIGRVQTRPSGTYLKVAAQQAV